MRPPLWPLLAAALLVAASPLRAQEDAAARWASHTEDGRSALASGALGRAELAMRDALAAALDLAAEDPRRAAALNNVGFVLHARGELKEAAIFYRQALELRERWLGAGDPAVAQSLVNLAELRREQGRPEEARAHYLRALAIREEDASDAAGLAVVRLGLAALEAERGEAAAAQAHYQGVLDLEGGLGSGHPGPMAARRGLARLLASSGSTDEALALLREALPAMPGPAGLPLLLDEALVLLEAGRAGEAAAPAMSALELLEAGFPPEPAATATALVAIARHQRAAGDVAAAEAATAGARALLGDESGETGRLALLDLLATAALWRIEEGRAEEADALLLEAMALARGDAEAAPLLETRARLLAVRDGTAEPPAPAEPEPASLPPALTSGS